MVKGIVFDMDGLMFNTERLAIDSWVYAGERIGQNIQATLIEQMIGLDTNGSQKIFIREFGEDFDYAAARKYSSEYMERYIEEHGLPIKPGLFELLDYLRDNSYRIAVASSTRRETILKLFHKAKVSGYFDQIVGGDMVKHGKPAPDIYLLACSKLELEPQSCLALEDSPAGILASHRAGMRVIMIPDIARPDYRIEDIPYTRFNSLLDVIGYLSPVTQAQ